MPLEIVTANRLADGRTVYLAEAGWSERLEAAQVAGSGPAAEALLALAERAAEKNEVVAPYRIEVVAEAGLLRPVRLRERIRAKGPTVAHGNIPRSKEAG